MNVNAMMPMGTIGRTSQRVALATTGAVVGLVLIAVGSALPWFTLFRGLQPQPGFLLDGGKLTGIGIAAAALLVVAARFGGARVLRPIAIASAAAIVLDSLLVGSRIAAFVADPGPAGPLTQPMAGPGTAVMAIGGGALLMAAIAAPLRSERLSRATAWSIALGGMLFVAGWIHMLLTPEHLEEAAILGTGFFLAGVVQIALAAAVVVRPRVSPWVAYSVIAVNTALIATYVNAVLVGLPFGGGDHDMAGGGLFRLGSGEAVDLFGLVTTIVQVGAIILALHALGSRASGIGQAADRS